MTTGLWAYGKKDTNVFMVCNYQYSDTNYYYFFLQLSQIKLAISATPAGSNRDDLIRLQRDIEELILLTKEHVDQNKVNKKNEVNEMDKEYALFKVCSNT